MDRVQSKRWCRPRITNCSPRATSGPPSVSLIKFYWHTRTRTRIRFQVICGGFSALTAEPCLQLKPAESALQSQKYLLSGIFQKTLAASWCRQCCRVCGKETSHTHLLTSAQEGHQAGGRDSRMGLGRLGHRRVRGHRVWRGLSPKHTAGGGVGWRGRRPRWGGDGAAPPPQGNEKAAGPGRRGGRSSEGEWPQLQALSADCTRAPCGCPPMSTSETETISQRGN